MGCEAGGCCLVKRLHVNGYEMAYLDIGRGPPVVCVHGALNDFRAWFGILSAMSDGRRLIVPSLRHYFPERWGGQGGSFSLSQHIDDVITFIEALGLGAVDLVGHSRGGLIGFRLALKRPDLLRKLVLAEPAGLLEEAIMPPEAVADTASGEMTPIRTIINQAAEKIAAGELQDGLRIFSDGIGGSGSWEKLAAAERQMREDNAYTLVAGSSDPLAPYREDEARALSLPTLFLVGAETTGVLPVISRVLANLAPNAALEVIPDAGHAMVRQQPKAFSSAVLRFLNGPSL